MASPTAQLFRCLGGGESAEGFHWQPDRYRDLLSLTSERPLSVRGAGLSLVGASFGAGRIAVDMSRFNRLLEFDPATGWLRAEAGITLGQLHDFLVPRGFSIAVQPGYPGLSLGGCIAGNVHGKNQFEDGCFANLVDDVTLFHPRQGIERVSLRERPELLELTCGGFGRTGLILDARILAHPLSGGTATVEHIAVGSLGATAERLDALRAQYDYLYSWNDLSRPCRGGRGFVVAGRMTSEPYGGPPRATRPLSVDRATPVAVFNRATMPLINEAFRRQALARPVRRLDLYSLLFPFAGKPYYFYAYGGQGFLEHQALVPADRIGQYGEALLAILSRHGVSCGLVSMKVFGGDRRNLWYQGSGFSIALHVPADDRARAALAEIDRLDCDSGAIANLIKDARLSASTVAAQYPSYGRIRTALRERDPENLFGSALTERLGL